jgi:hypothetical protein
MSYEFISKNSFVIFSSGGGPHVSTRVLRPAAQREPDQIAVISVVIGMLVGDEDMTQGRQRYSCEDKLSRNAVAAIDDVRNVVTDDDLGRRGTRFSRPRPASSAEEDESRRPALSRTGPGTRGRRDRERACEKCAPAEDWHVHVS